MGKTITQGNNNKHKATPVLLLELQSNHPTPVKISAGMLKEDAGGRTCQRMPLNDKKSLSIFNTLPAGVQHLLQPCTQEAMVYKELQLKEKFRDNPVKSLTLQQFVQEGMQQYLYHTLQQLRPLTPVLPWYTMITDDSMLLKHTRPATVNNFPPVLSFELRRTSTGALRAAALVTINGQAFPLSDFEHYGFVLRSRGELFILPPAAATTLEQFPGGFMDIPAYEEATFIEHTLPALSQQYSVDKSILLQKEIIETPPECNIWLSELNKSFLVLTPQWQYGNFSIEDTNEPVIFKAEGDIQYEIKRHVEAEKELIAFIRALHPRFAQQRNGYFYLPFADAEKSQWLVKCYRKLTDRNIGVYGMDQLQHFRYNTNVPVMDVRWHGDDKDTFDLEIDVHYGDIPVALADIQKALLHRQPHLLLKDGTIGVIPDEWLHKYDLLWKLGQVNKDKLKLSRLHFTVAQEMLDAQGTVVKENAVEQLQRLQAKSAEHFPVPAAIQAQLRTYQQAGFEWMCLLDAMRWGGCLADDMGLGKTLQTITFLQHLCEKYPGETHLVVCPTSLIYNWQAELQKFAPGLRYTVYHGGNRQYDAEHWKQQQLIITSYGTVRSDTAVFTTHVFGYVVLDESQVIKNPSSQTTRALQVMQSRNRLILSGTPIQNNTMDLYAQMNFANPGLLGNQAFFRSEFAMPIDKYADAEKAGRLRKLIYPFLLRRTKEQIAQDLPDKTEIIMWCEMGEEQRKSYNRIRDMYKEKLMARINEDGMAASTIYVLEGLTRLRQVCNAPQLVAEESHVTSSVKLDELMREISENTGTHKVLVFSQFTGMLQLIAKSMESEGLPFFYLDGSTKAEHRQQLVNQFQEDENIRVFLISLKAGGVGLTLTAADYVYLVDPWWNPAAEQQAIDRTHRIGQQNKVFAYKMICKDSVEEKILALQERKKMIADDLISEDTGFVKKLTEEDVAFLFS
ncbi:DEAD/DEAH box helicase [Chitinophaga sp. CF418]|uniref:DEAD/DEAH box helicase n=1 Tax=Chitinophaga sp. CF418 TaxID=1855287 RepID=UPI000915F963|nr:DEAD/DEAH box helicase [Chitinophaga sp. CF418]SHN37429.1 Superfamily II DNA or RNA helicase, SNF2 family [Chitinophaga sp. CF418]